MNHLLRALWPGEYRAGTSRRLQHRLGRHIQAGALVAADRLEPRTLLAGAPLLTLSAAPVEYTENDPPVALAPELSLVDDDTPLLTGAAVRIASGYQFAADVLSFVDQNGITGLFDPSTGVLTLSGNAPADAYQAALRSIRFANTSDTPSEGERTILFEASDGAESGTASKRLVVAAINDVPAATDDEYTVAEGGTLQVSAAPTLTVTPLEPLEEGGRTINKPQSKVWKHGETWWSVLGFIDQTGKGTALYRLDGDTWIRELVLFNNDSLADVKVAGDVAHVLLEKGTQTRLVSLEYVDGLDGLPGSYQFWSARPEAAVLNLPAGIEAATIDIDSTGRMWVAYDDSGAVRVKYSNGPYAVWSAPITLDTGVALDDIAAIMALPTGRIGVIWSNQNTQRFVFRTHLDGTDPNVWTAAEMPAADEALDVNLGLADDHLSMAAASDGTLYVAVKTGYDQAGLPLTALLVRRPNGAWDPMYTVNDAGTRGIVQLNDETRTLLIAYRDGDNIVFNLAKDDGQQITVQPEQVLIPGNILLNSPTGSKAGFTDDLVVLASRDGVVSGVRIAFQFGILANDTDAEADPVSAVLVDGPLHGSLTLAADGAFTYVHDGSETTTDRFTYRLHDGTESGNVATVAILVTPVNDPPVAQPDQYTVVRGGTLTAWDTDGTSVSLRDDGLLANDGDPEGDLLTVELVSGPAFGSLTLNADGTFTYTHDGSNNLLDGFSYLAHDGGADSSPVSVTIEVNTGPNVRTGIVSGVTNTGWTTVTLDRAYKSMIVVATPNYGPTSVPLVTRIRNASGDRFEIKLDRLDGSTAAVPGIDVYYLVVEEGVYTEPEHGVTMEAVRYVSTVTDYLHSRIGERRLYENVYENPVVVGQVMSVNDVDFSVFWSRGSHKDEIPTESDLFVGKHVGEDPDHTRADELIGYIVIESGSGQIDGRTYLAEVGADIVRGVVAGQAYVYDLGELESPTTAVVSMAAMNGNDGGWALLYGNNPISAAGLRLAMDEDQINDAERNHTDERVAFIAFGPPPPNSPPVSTGETYRAVQAGVLVADDVTGSQGDAGDDGVLANDDDPDGDSLTAQLVSGPGFGSLTLNADGSFVYIHDGSAAASDQFTYRAFDGVAYGQPVVVEIIIDPAPRTVSFQDGRDGYSGTADATIVADSSATNFGALNELAMDGSPDRAALLRWDLTSLAPGTTVLSATITVNVTNLSGDFYEIYAVAGNWLEQEVTWLQAANGVPWQTPGAASDVDRAPQILGLMTAPSTGTASVELNAAGIAVLQSWINNPNANFGLIFQDYANGTSNGLEVSSREAASVSNRPMLTLTYLSGGALPENAAPDVDAGADLAVLLTDVTQLNGAVSDDGLPNPPGAFTTLWSVVDGPGTVTFADASLLQTSVQFAAAGTYRLRLTADDGALTVSDELTVTVASPSDTWSVSFQDGRDGYAGTTDATILVESPGTNFGNSIELEMDGAPDKATLLRWDLASVAPDSMVVGASITVNVTNRSDDFFEIFGVLRPWVENEVTWLQAAQGTAWTTAGASAVTDRGPTSIGALTAPSLGTVTVELGAPGIALVQSWIDNSASNFGLIFQTYVGAGNGLDMLSSEASNAALRPMLTVMFSYPPDETAAPLLAAFDVSADARAVDTPAAVTAEQLSGIAAEAADRWIAALEPDQAALAAERLERVNYEIVDLAADQLGAAAGSTVRIDRNAAGRGWFVDATPSDDLEFVRTSAPGGWIALPGSPADARFDLLSAVMHELGHLLGYAHTGDGVMEAALQTGRRTAALRAIGSSADEHLEHTGLEAADALFAAFGDPAVPLLDASM